MIFIFILQLNFNKVLSSSFLLQRAASLPVATKSCPPRTHRNSHGDTMALAPPFASPSKESVLTMSGEHAPICNIGKFIIILATEEPL